MTQKNNLETKDIPLNLKAIGAGGEVEGYASLFGVEDLGGDVVVKGAFTKSLAQNESKKRNIKMLWQHDPAQPIGVWEDVREDEKGLWVKGRILNDVAKGREAASLIEAGAIDGLSIGYRTVNSAKDAGGLRLLTELQIWEVSFVTFPMLPGATVDIRKDVPQGIIEKLKAGDRLTEREFGRLVKGFDLSNSQAERAARVHLKGQGEPAKAVQSGEDYQSALLLALLG